jgi:DHA1 family inner membrane transport protein
MPRDGDWLGRSLVVPMLTLATFLSALANFAFGPFLPDLAADLHTSVSSLGLVLAIAALVTTVVGLVVGPIADQVGCRRVMLIALASIGVSMVGVGLSWSIPVLISALLIGTVGRAACTPLAQAVVGSQFAEREQRGAIGWLTAGTSGAVVIGVPLLTSLSGALGWRAAFGCIALIALVNAGVLGTLLHPARRSLGAPRSLRDVLGAYSTIVRDVPSLGLMAGTLLGVAGTSTILTYAGAFFHDVHQLSTQQIGWVYLAVGAGATIGSVSTRWLTGDRPLRPVLVGSRLVMAELAVTALVMPLPSLATAGLLTVAFALAAMSTVMSVTLLSVETPAARATTMTLNTSAASLGTALGSTVGGLVLGSTDYGALGLTAAAWYLTGGAIVWFSQRSVPAADMGAQSSARIARAA